MIAILLANGFEEIEALTPADMLRRAGKDVRLVGMNGKTALGSHGISVGCDALPEELDLHSIELVIFPGGMPGAKNLDIHPFTDTVIEAVTKNGGRIAAICAAPMILGKRGLLNGKRATCYPGFEGELTGASVSELSVVSDGNITTAKGMGVALEFSLELVSLILGKNKAEEIKKSIMMK